MRVIGRCDEAHTEISLCLLFAAAKRITDGHSRSLFVWTRDSFDCHVVYQLANPDCCSYTRVSA